MDLESSMKSLKTFLSARLRSFTRLKICLHHNWSTRSTQKLTSTLVLLVSSLHLNPRWKIKMLSFPSKHQTRPILSKAVIFASYLF